MTKKLLRDQDDFGDTIFTYYCLTSLCNQKRQIINYLVELKAGELTACDAYNKFQVIYTNSVQLATNQTSISIAETSNSEAETIYQNYEAESKKFRNMEVIFHETQGKLEEMCNTKKVDTFYIQILIDLIQAL